jgi:diguanylate cyclase (GGDEF)-like protein/PAS domain S-box-containing protein
MKGGRQTGSVLTIRDISDQAKTLDELRDSEEYYRLLLDTSPDGIVVADLYGYIVKANQRAAKLYGFADTKEMLEGSLLERVAPEDRIRAARDKRTTIEDGEVRNIEYVALRRDGSTFTAEVSTSLILHPDGRPKAVMNVIRDRTVHKQAEDAVRQSEAAAALQYAATAVLAESASLGDAIPKLLQTLGKGAAWDMALFWGVNRNDSEMRCRFVWRAPKIEAEDFDLLSRQMRFIPGVGLPGRVWGSGEPLWLRDVLVDPTYTRALVASKAGLHTVFCLPIRMEGRVRAVVEFYSRDLRDPNMELVQMMQTLSRHVGQFMKRREAEEALEHQAFHDPLTDLANRLLFQSRMDRAILSSWAENTTLSVLLMDLNKFKQINDMHGHHFGDEILLQTANRLRRTLRDSDTVARLGGDEFAVLLNGTDAGGAKIVASKIVQALTQPVIFEGKTLRVGASIGIALYPHDGEDTNTVLQHADAAMYAIKRTGGGFAVYEPAHDALLANRAQG